MSLLNNWYFCLSENTLKRHNHAWTEMALVAVRSCLKHTSLKPNLIYTGNPNSFTELMEKEGVNIIYHTTVLYDTLRNKYKDDDDNFNIALGAFLRLDIPLLVNDKFALYTDVDVIFNKQIDTSESVLNSIKNFMAAPQFSQTDYENDLNSGVLVLNIRDMRNIYLDLIDFARDKILTHPDKKYFDQEVLREFFPLSRRSSLSTLYNWKPYWGYNLHASIIHFHGPKALAVKERLESDVPFPDAWEELLDLNIDAYKEYIKLFESYL